jgi:hypothetical protein
VAGTGPKVHELEAHRGARSDVQPLADTARARRGKGSRCAGISEHRPHCVGEGNRRGWDFHVVDTGTQRTVVAIRVGADEEAARADRFARRGGRETVRDPAVTARVVRALGTDRRDEDVAPAVQFSYVLALRPAVERRP